LGNNKIGIGNEETDFELFGAVRVAGGGKVSSICGYGRTL
jgi:hypothetical protein